MVQTEVVLNSMQEPRAFNHYAEEGTSKNNRKKSKRARILFHMHRALLARQNDEPRDRINTGIPRISGHPV